MEKFTNILDFISWVEKQRRFTEKTSLDRINYYASLFDHPESTLRIIHITGTNGKGSTVAGIRAILMEAGFNVATFTSPYITVFNERIEYNGVNISDNDLLKYGNMIINKYDKIVSDGYDTPSFFEFITLLAFLYFHDLHDLDFTILEVGMGGRLDSTNIVKSDVAVISNVALEHTKILGDTLEKIAIEKLGIVKNGEPLICGIKEENIQNLVKKVCQERNSKLYLSTPRKVEIKKMDIYGSHFVLEGFEDGLYINLPGFHQIDNAKVIVTTIEVLNDLYHGLISGFPISKDQIKLGLSKIIWPGRLEILKENPLIVTDGAHNNDGITQVCNFVKSLDYEYKRAVVSISKDKTLNQMVAMLDDTFDEIIFTKYAYARSSDEDILFMLSNCKNKMMIHDVKESLDYVMSHQVPFTIYLGSLYLVTDIRKLIKENENGNR